MEHCHGVLNSSFGSYTLNRLHYDALGLLVGGKLGFVHDVVDVACSSSLGFVLERLDELLLCLLG